LLEQAITGVLPLPLYGDTTLTNYNGLSDQARNAVLFLTGNLTSSCNVIAPSGQQKVYIVRNFAGATVNIKTATGNAVSLTNAASAVVFTDGTDFYSATTLNYIDGNLTVTGTTDLKGQVTLESDVFGNTNTGQWYFPVGTTNQRTSSPTNGVIRYNTTQQIYEGYANGSWVRFQVYPEGIYTVQYLIAAGGGGGGGGTGGGGGAGGLVTGSITATATTTYNIVIGGGGAPYANGTTSYITGVASTIGGGYGATNTGYPAIGGSGGGGGSDGFNGGNDKPGAAGTTGQGNAGGNGGFAADPRSDGGGGGGGGAGTAGASAGAYGPAGNGGTGAQSSITGTAVYYAGGGGGGAGGGGSTPPTGPGGGGAGGGGSGGTSTSPANGTGNNGGSNTGGGAGGGGAGYGVGGTGGSGVVILSMPTINYTGQTTGSPTVTTTGANTVLKFTGSGSYTA
jgi:hypothetical protein